MSTQSGVLDLDLDIDKLADESISIAVLESGEIIANMERPVPTEEGEDDEVDIHYARVGEALGDAKKILYYLARSLTDLLASYLFLFQRLTLLKTPNPQRPPVGRSS
nr:hypothetical protein GCM10020185_67500 [Pseudomonas brassicacearum subsp. brassicacearum]